MSEYTILALITIYFVAGVVKGTFGVGFPTAAIAMAATLFDARTAIAFVVIPMCLLNGWQVYRSGSVKQVLVSNWPLVVSMSASIAIFSLLSAQVPIRWLTLLLGVVTALFAIVSLWRSTPELPERYDKPAQLVTGVVAGVIGGLAGIWAPPIVIYLTSRRVSKAVFVQVVGVVLFIGSFLLLLGYVQTGIVNEDNALISFALLLPAIAGFTVGEKLRNKMSNELFYKLILIMFLVLGLNFVRRSLFM